MPSGGARTRSGPAPDPMALRRARDGDDWIVLPAAGREGPTPSWPLPSSTARERTLWSELWRMPQATQWEANQQQLFVALYCRRFIEAEKRGSTVNLSTLVRQMGDDLGLTTGGLARNRWRIAKAEEKTDGPSRFGGRSRSRFTVVNGGA